MLQIRKVTVRLSDLLDDQLQVAAAQAGLTPSEFIRFALAEKLQTTDEYDYPSHAKWAAAVLARDKRCCSNCGARSEPRAHHILPRVDGGRNCLSNGITLCQKCHIQEHGTKSLISANIQASIRRGEKILPKLSEVKTYADAIEYSRRGRNGHSAGIATAVCVAKGIAMVGRIRAGSVHKWLLEEEGAVRTG